MTVETMNVHQALCELKTLEKRIMAAVREPQWVITCKHSTTKVSGVDVKEWEKETKAKLQKAMDLIARRDAIKRAVVNSNAVTKVTVAGKEYTVAEAIDRKNHGVGFLEMLAQRIAHDLTTAKAKAERENGMELERRADDHVRIMIGNSDMKGATVEAQRLRDEFIKAQTTDLIDPIGAQKMIEELDKETTDFLMNVDAALSVSNAVTNIVVEY